MHDLLSTVTILISIVGALASVLATAYAYRTNRRISQELHKLKSKEGMLASSPSTEEHDIDDRNGRNDDKDDIDKDSVTEKPL